MKRIFIPCLIVLILAAITGIAVAQSGGQRVSVEQAMVLPDKSLVILTGYVVEDLGDRKYMFSDGTARIRLDVGFWDGAINRQMKALRPIDRVEIFGDIHDEREAGRRVNPQHVHVKSVTRL